MFSKENRIFSEKDSEIHLKNKGYMKNKSMAYDKMYHHKMCLNKFWSIYQFPKKTQEISKKDLYVTKIMFVI